jgi:hypothetical protein
MTRDDPELGTERLCPGCDEFWPFDDEFWHIRDGRLSSAWPHRCRACCADYYAARLRLRLRDLAQVESQVVPVPADRCRNPMMSREVCGRRAGHKGWHRSGYAMNNERLAKAERRSA